MPYFDVKKVSTSEIDDCIGSRSINLMCAILRSITYKQLYDEPFHTEPKSNLPPSTLDTIISNIDSLPGDLQKGATIDDYIVIEKLAGRSGAFIKIREKFEAEDYPRLELKELFYDDPDDGITTPRKKVAKFIIDALEHVHDPDPVTKEDQMFHFCVPFLTVRKNRVPAPPGSGDKRPRKSKPCQDDLRQFLKDLGDCTMQDFYDVRQDDYARRRRAAVHALDHCIMKEHGRPNKPKGPQDGKSDDPLGKKSTDGNKKRCTGTTSGCASCEHPDDWCNDYYINGSSGPKQCSLGSDYHT